MQPRVGIQDFVKSAPAAYAGLSALGKAVDDSGSRKKSDRIREAARFANERMRLLRLLPFERAAQAARAAREGRPYRGLARRRPCSPNGRPRRSPGTEALTDLSPRRPHGRGLCRVAQTFQRI